MPCPAKVSTCFHFGRFVHVPIGAFQRRGASRETESSGQFVNTEPQFSPFACLSPTELLPVPFRH